MKKIVVILLFLMPGLIQLSSFGQAEKFPVVNADIRVSEAFGSDFVSDLEVNDPLLVLYYNYYLDNAYYIEELPFDKSDFLDNLVSVNADPASDKKEINILTLGLELNFEKRTYYRMSKSQSVMVFYTGQEFTDKFNKYREEKGFLNTNQNK